MWPYTKTRGVMSSLHLRAYRYLPWLVLMVSLSITYQFWDSEKQEAVRKHQTGFDFRAQEVSSLVVQKIQLYKQALIGLQSFFEASQTVERSEFRDYVRKFLIAEAHSSIRSVGYIELISSSQIAQHTKKIQSTDYAEYLIYPEGNRPQYAPVRYIEPQNKHNLSRIGFDTFTDQVRRNAMERARSLDNATVTSRVSFLEDANGNSDPSFLMYLPIYKNGLPHKTTRERTENLIGWVFMKVAADDLIDSALRNSHADLLVELYDGNTQNSLKLLGRSKNNPHFIDTNAEFRTSRTAKVLDQQWLFRIYSLPEFEKQRDYNRASLVAYAGVSASLMLTFLMMLLVSRERSLRSIREINNRLGLSEQRWKFALEGSGDGVWDWNAQTNEVEFSRQWKRMLGYEEDEIKNNFDEWKRRIHPEDVQRVMAELEAYLKGHVESYVVEHRLMSKYGKWKWILSRGMIVSYTPAHLPLRMVGTHTDISKIKESEEVVWKHANFDSLTSLPNRRMFYDRLELEIKKTNRTQLKMALLFIDLDRFKEVNDTLGHDQGDVLLKETASRLTGCVRATDTVARLGGDEFMVILGDLENINTAERIAQEILISLAEPFKLDNELAYVSGSIGITFYPDDAHTVEDLVKNVDQAMYAAKSAGANRYSYFTPSMQRLAQARMQLANDLRQAISEKQFHMVYQPIIELKSGKIQKAEALLRWQHPVRGAVDPMEFIPIAEDTGLVIEIGDFVLETAVEQVRAWQQSIDPQFQITVNKSPVQFYHQSKLHRSWSEFLKQSGIAGSSIVVEITEGLLLDMNEHVTEELEQFRDSGMQVAIDDFGTGYSSLSYIKKFHIDYIKIDKSFVASLALGSDDLALCEAIIMMAHKLGMKVIAEGVETELQRDLLMAASCDFGQGYLFSHALDAQAFEQLVADEIKA